MILFGCALRMNRQNHSAPVMTPPPPPPRRPSAPTPSGGRPLPPSPPISQAETLFARAAALPAEERERLLAEVEDAALAQEVRELLTADASAGDFLREEAPLSPEMEYELARLKPEEAGERIGPYKLLQELGQGGFGTVWMAEQEQPVRRRVALKIIKLGMDTKEVIARFEQERQALALMEHPNIARVFDAGATPFGRPFFVMELVRGVPITEYCDEAALSTRERLELFTQVCAAIQHATKRASSIVTSSRRMC